MKFQNKTRLRKRGFIIIFIVFVSDDKSYSALPFGNRINPEVPALESLLDSPKAFDTVQESGIQEANDAHIFRNGGAVVLFPLCLGLVAYV